MTNGCGAPVQTSTAVDEDTRGQVVVTGKVTGADGPLGGAFVRLLDGNGEFTGEVQASPEGDFGSTLHWARGWCARCTERAVVRPPCGPTVLVHRVAVTIG